MKGETHIFDSFQCAIHALRRLASTSSATQHRILDMDR
jgi:hypothetical protein